jgi:hypothetical protein
LLRVINESIEKSFEQLASGLENKCSWKEDAAEITGFSRTLSPFDRVSIISRIDPGATKITSYVKEIVANRIEDLESFIEGVVYASTMKEKSGVSLVTRIMTIGESGDIKMAKQLTKVIEMIPEMVVIEGRKCHEVIAKIFSLFELFYVVCTEKYLSQQTNEQLTQMEKLTSKKLT